MTYTFVRTDEFNRFRERILKRICCLSKGTLDINAQTTSYTLVLEDESTVLETNSASANTITVPLNADVPFPIGTEITILQYGAGQTTVAGDTGVTIVSAGGLMAIAAQYAGVTLIKRDTDEWYLVGNLA